MKRIIERTVLVVLVLGLGSCAGGRDQGSGFEQEPPFTLGAVYFQKWVAGVQNGGSGVNVYVEIESYLDDVMIEDIYFRNKKIKAQNSPQYRDLYVGYFKSEKRPDIIMHDDPVKETVNTPPEKIPFNLNDDEAVLSYLHKGEMKFIKLVEIEEKPMIAYPGMNNEKIE